MVMGDMTAKGGDKCTDALVGKWDVPEKNDNSDDLVDVCTDMRLLLTNTYFKHKMIYWNMWRIRGVQNEQ